MGDEESCNDESVSPTRPQIKLTSTQDSNQTVILRQPRGPDGTPGFHLANTQS